ncbi:MAG: NAD(P)H-binding protein [Bdellovibrionaceae bacterium]|nr:NAD(P)H-binding protein [Pseudobdellovibrionaceae bacterium]
MNKVLVIGASGTVGTELVKLLKAKGQPVAEATSKKDLKQGQVHLNLLNQDGIEDAFENVDRVFLLSPPGHTNQDKLLLPLIEMAKSKKVKKVVLMTAMGANAVESASLRIAEIQLEKSGLNYNIIRPNWFMQNFNSYWIQGINNDGKIYLPVAKAKGSFIDARDIAAVAAELLVSDKFNNQDFDLTGSDVINHDQVAEILSITTGRKISYQDIEPAAMRAGLIGAGLPKDYAEFMLVILDFFKQGYAERTTDAIEKITGRKPISFKKYAEDYKSSWIK